MIKKCPICDKEFKTKNKNQIWCSVSCMTKSPERKEKLKIASKKANEKRRQTMIERYGVDNPSKSEEINEKRKQTCLAKYGVEYSGSSKELIQKREKNNLQKYGVKHNFQINEVKEKRKQTNLKKYGVENPFANKEIQEKIKNTNIERYGVKNPAQSQQIKDKIQQTTIEKYGAKYYNQKDINHLENYNKEYIESHFIENNIFKSKEFQEYFGITGGRNTVNTIKNKLGINVCNEFNKNKTQKEIQTFIKSFYDKEFVINTRKIIAPLELDIYLPEDKLAIEFDGLMYHSYGESDVEKFNNIKEDKNYHLRKTELCESCGIQLLHIFENEWEDKQDLWKSMIKVKLGYADNKLHARECEIRKVEALELKNFLEANHIQGYINSSINYGLYHNGELVQVMTFSKSRFNKRYNWELIRECSKLNTIVRGGYSKLLKHFHNNYKGSLISYANRRWSSPLTNNNGMLIKTTEPNYFYFLPNEYILYSRNRFQKHKLENLLKVFDKNIPETQNMFNNGYRRIYDCGNLLYEL